MPDYNVIAVEDDRIFVVGEASSATWAAVQEPGKRVICRDGNLWGELVGRVRRGLPEADFRPYHEHLPIPVKVCRTEGCCS